MSINIPPQHSDKAVDTRFTHDELCDFDVTIAKFVLPRLIAFSKETQRTPTLKMTMQEWHEILDKMIYAVDKVANGTEEDTPEYKAYIAAIWNNEEDLADLKRQAMNSLKPVNEGLELFHKYYRSLWW